MNVRQTGMSLILGVFILSAPKALWGMETSPSSGINATPIAVNKPFTYKLLVSDPLRFHARYGEIEATQGPR